MSTYPDPATLLPAARAELAAETAERRFASRRATVVQAAQERPEPVRMTETPTRDDYEYREAAPGFGATLRGYRDKRKFSQTRLAEAAGFDHSYVSRLESGDRIPSREAVATLADALTLTGDDRARLFRSHGFIPDELEGWIDAGLAMDEAEREALQSLTPEKRAGILALIGTPGTIPGQGG